MTDPTQMSREQLVAEVTRLRAELAAKPKTRRPPPEPTKCTWCGQPRRRWSDWQQERLKGGWARLCNPCARRRLNNPFNAVLPLRKVAT